MPEQLERAVMDLRQDVKRLEAKTDKLAERVKALERECVPATARIWDRPPAVGGTE